MVTKSDGRGDCVGLGGFEPGHGDAYYNNTCALPGMSGESGKVGGVPCDPQQVDMHGARTSGHFFVARNLCRGSLANAVARYNMYRQFLLHYTRECVARELRIGGWAVCEQGDGAELGEREAA